MAGTAAADELNDRERFRGLFRTELSTRNIGPALATVTQDFKQVAVITEGESPFTEVHGVAILCGLIIIIMP
jgi:hypothetical protein